MLQQTRCRPVFSCYFVTPPVAHAISCAVKTPSHCLRCKWSRQIRSTVELLGPASRSASDRNAGDTGTASMHGTGTATCVSTTCVCVTGDTDCSAGADPHPGTKRRTL